MSNRELRRRDGGLGGIYEPDDELVPIWGQFDEPWEGTLAAEPRAAGAVDEPPGGVDVDDPLGGVAVETLDVGVAADAEPDEAVVGEGEPPVAALATAAPPPTRTPASPTPASVCRSRIFIASPPSLLDAAHAGH